MITEEQIIEYLKHCSTTESCHKDKCPCLKDGHTCIAFEPKPVLEFINRQKAEVEQLNTVNAEMHESLRLACETNKDMQAEIKRLKEQVNLWQEEAGSVGCANEWLRASLKNARAEAIKEFAERLKETELYEFIEEYFENAELCYEVRHDQFYEHIDNLVKEMVGDAE